MSDLSKVLEGFATATRAFFATVNVGGSMTFNSTGNLVDGVINNFAEDGEPPIRDADATQRRPGVRRHVVADILNQDTGAGAEHGDFGVAVDHDPADHRRATRIRLARARPGRRCPRGAAAPPVECGEGERHEALVQCHVQFDGGVGAGA